MFSVLIAISLYPVAQWLERLKLGKAFSALLSVILAIVLITGLIWFIIHQVIVIGRNGSDIQEKFLSILDAIQNWLTQKFGVKPTELSERLRAQTSQALSHAGTYLSAAFGSLGSILAGLVLVPLYTFFCFITVFFLENFSSMPLNQPLKKLYTIRLIKYTK
ncbi:protein of unknown function DUF20 [bacterium A37T11]|nr:protein of unknown function DUF20 [bacterium A37T11]